MICPECGLAIVEEATDWHCPACSTYVYPRDTEERQKQMAEAKERKDGFRKPKKRPKGWLAGAIKRGEVRDPNAPPPETRESDGYVVHVPLAESLSTGTDR